MFITQEKYLEAANRNLKEWFVDDNLAMVFIPLVARDFLTAYLMKFQDIGITAPDIEWVLKKLDKYDKNVVQQFKPLNIKFKEKIKSREYYLDLLFNCKNYVENRL